MHDDEDRRYWHQLVRALSQTTLSRPPYSVLHEEEERREWAKEKKKQDEEKQRQRDRRRKLKSLMTGDELSMLHPGAIKNYHLKREELLGNVEAARALFATM